ncbi:protein angel homolog 2-like [Actinia tenebrosa]|uniref:Protein angel homolog 2-like n=1 Tax=Actinia tenebrosa TaxID=6105 RepID=A0A6P8HSN6_ACTTE|nr:protein angel homolog 2-like [Actinia tenebrosa]
MSRRGIKAPFWANATRKAGFDRESSSTSTQKSEMMEEDEDFDVLPPPPDTKELTEKELTTNTASNASPCCTYAQKQPRTLASQEKSPKRLRTHSTGESEASDFIPPENPCFVDSADVGRTWYYTRRNNRRHRNRSIPFKIVTYNVLADSLLKSHPALYEDCSAWCLEWEYRKKNLLKEILHYNADILCLQEVEDQHYENWFKPELLKAGYQGTYKKRTGDKVDGCATFYKESKFRIVTHQFFDYKREDVPVMDRDNVAMLTLLYPRYRDGGTCHSTALCVVNTHLLFNKNRGDIKLLQLACLFAEIDKLKKEYLLSKAVRKPHTSIKKIPVVLSGDFNTTPFCPLYNFITRGFLDYKGMNKKALSGQNPPHHVVYRDRDVINGNIVPLELGLSHLSVWDEEPAPAQDQAGGTSSSQTNSIFAEDNFDAANSGWQEGRQEYSSTFHSAMPQQRGTSSNIPPLLSQHQQTTYRYHRGHPFEPAVTYHAGNMTVSMLSRHQLNTFSGNIGTLFTPRQAVDDLPRYHVPPEPVNPRHNPTCTILKHNLHFYSVYRHYLPNRIKEVTTYHEKEPSCTVDYMFIAAGREFSCSSCRQRHAALELTDSLRLLSEEQISLLGGLPNQKLSSDHLALVAGFVLHV